MYVKDRVRHRAVTKKAMVSAVSDGLAEDGERWDAVMPEKQELILVNYVANLRRERAAFVKSYGQPRSQERWALKFDSEISDALTELAALKIKALER